MFIRRKSGKAGDGEVIATCRVTGTVFDKNGAPQNVVKGTEYYVSGRPDKAIFDVALPVKEKKEVK